MDVVYDYSSNGVWLECCCSFLCSLLKWCGLWKNEVRLVVSVLVNVCYLLLFFCFRWFRYCWKLCMFSVCRWCDRWL